MYFLMRKTKKMIDNADENGLVYKLIEKEFEGNCYRTYSFIDLLSLVQIRNQLKRE